MHITGYLSLAGIQYPYDVTLASGQSASFSNAGCSYHIEVTQNAGSDTVELWVDGFVGANLPIYAQVVVIPGVAFTFPRILSRCSTASANQFADLFVDSSKYPGVLQVATPWTPSAVDISGYNPTSSFGLGINNTSGFSSPALFLGYAPLYTVVPPQAPDQSITCEEQSTDASVTPAITANGNPITGYDLAIVQSPTSGTARVSGAQLLYTPRLGFFGTDSFAYKAISGGVDSNVATVTVTVLPKRNCDCNDATSNRTLKQLRDDLMRRLGFGAQVNNPPPGMADLLNSFLIEAQELLYRRYDVLRTERLFSWDLQQGVRFYDVDANIDLCTKRLDPRKITWVGLERDGIWYPLTCGIPPELYSHDQWSGWPQRYEIRSCIEVWPVPDATPAKLYVKGRFEIEPFAADTDKTTIDDRAVFLLALANAKAHYGRPDASNYVQELESYMQTLVAGAHQTRRYIPGHDARFDPVYIQPKPVTPWP